MGPPVLDDYQVSGFQIQVVDYSFSAAGVVLFYNYILSIRHEVSLVWFSRWSPTKVLFLLTRYLPFVAIVLTLDNQLSKQQSPSICTAKFHAAFWTFLIEMNIAEIILAIRTWAVWRRNIRVGIFLVVVVTTCLVTEVLCLRSFVETLQFAPALSSQFIGCRIVFTSPLLYILYIPFILIEIIFLALIAIRAYPAYKLGGVCELTNVVYRDGVTFYIYILSFSIVNTIIILVLPYELSTMLYPMEGVIYSVLTAQIVFDIREVIATKDNETDSIEISVEIEIAQSLEDLDSVSDISLDVD